MQNIVKYIGWCLLTFIPLCSIGQVSSYPFVLPSSSINSIEKISEVFQNNGLHTVNLNQTGSIYGVAISGHIAFRDANNSMVRVTAVCSNGIEYLVYETSPLLADGQDFDIEDVAMETALLDADSIVKLNVILMNATFLFTDIVYNKEPIQNVSKKKRELAVNQENALISRLNENLEKRGNLWRAGKTPLSSMTYEQKKAIFGDIVPYLGGYEYYIGGIFVAPGYTSTQNKTVPNNAYVTEWDWRNRHGKNWITSVKNQGTYGACWAFSVVGSIESYINLYYNRMINADLSEQYLISCFSKNTHTEGEWPKDALNYIKENGIVLESCFPYVASKVNCDKACIDTGEKIRIENHYEINKYSNTEDDLKKSLFRAPLCFGIPSWKHEMLLVGYKVIKEGDVVYTNSKKSIIVQKGNALIGSTAWLFKNSWGTSFGTNGYAYVVVDWNDTYCINPISGKIKSNLLFDSDILALDEDGDGFYFWGIGDRPSSSLPDWAPLEPDGDDSDATKGAMDDYGNLKPSGKIKNVQTTTTWTSLSDCLPIVFVENGATLTLKGTMCLNPNSCIFVRNGASLVLDGVTLNHASIKVYNGGRLVVKNGAVLNRDDGDILEVDLGGVMEWTSGTMVQQ